MPHVMRDKIRIKLTAKTRRREEEIARAESSNSRIIRISYIAPAGPMPAIARGAMHGIRSANEQAPPPSFPATSAKAGDNRNLKISVDLSCSLCTGRCGLFKISLRTGPPPRLPHQKRRPNRAGSVSPQGYVRVMFRGSTYGFQRTVWELLTDEPLPPGHDVHHRDGNKLNNCPYNLQLVPHSTHCWHHARTLPLLSYCEHCSRAFLSSRAHRKAGCRKPRRFCSSACAIKRLRRGS